MISLKGVIILKTCCEDMCNVTFYTHKDNDPEDIQEAIDEYTLHFLRREMN